MPSSARVSLCCVIGLLTFSQCACNLVPHQALRQSQCRTMHLHRQNQAIAMQRDQANQMAQSAATEKAALESQLRTANKRLSNLNAERTELQQRYVNVLNRVKNQPNPLSESAIARLKELDKKYPEFEFDPYTGVSKFHSDVLFDSGHARIKNGASPLLGEFASIMNDPAAQSLNILVVGHTDSRPIAKKSTRSKHPTNWHLSSNRANSVLLALSKMGVKQARMGVAAYGKYQPVASNKDKKSRMHNRRVEIFVLAPEAVVAGWEPAISSRN